MSGGDRRESQALASLIHPLPTHDFIQNYWRKEIVRVEGNAQKFLPLMDWGTLNRILEQHHLEPPRLRLLREGELLPAARFLDYREDNGSRSPRLSPRRLSQELRNGATLVLNQIDSLHAPLTALSERLERYFCVPVGINAYAGFGEAHGMQPHCDKHEVLILQIAGRKRWILNGHADGKTVLDETPPDRVIWNHCLNPGDCLYVPRGCWHVVIPQNEPSLHLTISISNPTVNEVIGWLSQNIQSTEFGYVDVSPFDSADDRAKFCGEVRSRMNELLAGDVLSRYFRSADANRNSKIRMSLPWNGSTRPTLPESGGVRYRSTSRRKIVFEEGPERAVEFTSNGHRWRYPAIMRSLLVTMDDGNTHTVSELVELSEGQWTADSLSFFLPILIADGHVSVSEEL